MPITALPTPPSRNDPANFATRADAFMAALPAFATETNATAVEVDNDRIASAASASTATTQVGLATAQVALASAQRVLAETAANAASATANVTQWISGTTYALGANVWSPINAQTYRRIIAGAGTTDPSADATNWTKISENLTVATQAEMEAGSQTGLRSMSPLRVLQAINANAAGPKITAVVSGTISAGAPVLLNSSGQAVAIATSPVTSPTFVTSSQPGAVVVSATTYDSKRNRFYLFYTTSTSLNMATYGVVLGVSGTAVSLINNITVSASSFIFQAGKTPLCAYNPITDKVAYLTQTNTYDSTLYVGTCSDSLVAFTSISAGTWMDGYAAICVPNNHILFAARKYPNSGVSIAAIDTTSATPSIGQITIDTSNNWDGGAMTYDSSANKIHLIMTKTSGSHYIYSLDPSGSLLVTSSLDVAGVVNYCRLAYSSVANKTVFSYSGGIAKIGTYDNTAGTWSFGTAVTFGSGTYTRPVIATDGRLLVYYATSFKIGTISGTSISFGSAISTGIDSNNYTLNYSYSTASNVTFNMSASVVYGVLTNTTLTSENFAGFSVGSYTNGQTASVNTVGSVNISQTSLTPASKYYVSPSATLTTANTGVYAGLATTATSILVKG